MPSSKVMVEVFKLVSRVKSIQHTKVKQQTGKFNILQTKHTPNGTKPLFRMGKQDTFMSDLQRKKKVKPIRQEAYTDQRGHASQKSVFCSNPRGGTGVDIIATESAIRNNKLSEVEQIRLKVSAALTNTKAKASNITTQERRALASLAKDKDMTV